MEFAYNLENPLGISDELLEDSITSLFKIESEQMLSNAYRQSIKDITSTLITVRDVTVSVILKLSQKIDPFLSYLAISYLDRYLSCRPMMMNLDEPWLLKLLAVSCVSLASKMTRTETSITDMQVNIQSGGGQIIDSRTIGRMEFLILSALEWRMRSITPFSFIKFFISLFEFKDLASTQALKDRATKILLKAQNVELLEFKPSIIAAAALLYAAYELVALQFPPFKEAILSCSNVDKDNFLSCYSIMQEVILEDHG